MKDEEEDQQEEKIDVSWKGSWRISRGKRRRSRPSSRKSSRISGESGEGATAAVRGGSAGEGGGLEWIPREVVSREGGLSRRTASDWLVLQVLKTSCGRFPLNRK